MLSLTVNTPKPFLSSPFLHHHHHHLHHHPPPLNPRKPPKPLSISALILPSSSPSPSAKKPQLQVYQPFRPPVNPLPGRYRTLDTSARLEILSNRLGHWYEYASLIPPLISEGFTSSTLEEITGIASIQQNLLVVASQVRDSLVEVADAEIVSHFDPPGSPEILYQIRILNAQQRAAAARFIIDFGYDDAKRTEELARAMKDYPRRYGDRGWMHFDGNSPGDCLAYMYYRQARDSMSPEVRRTSLERALEVVETEKAKEVLVDEIEGKKGEGEAEQDLDTVVSVPVVRMGFGEVAESSNVVAFPRAKGILPWKDKRKDTGEEILVVADRGRKEVDSDEGCYLVMSGGNGSGYEGLKVERGLKLKQMGVETSLGTVVLVVRPPREEANDQIADEEWD